MEPADSCNTLSNRPQRGRTGARKLANFLNDLFEGEFQIKDVTFFLFLSLIRVRKNARQVLKNGFMF